MPWIRTAVFAAFLVGVAGLGYLAGHLTPTVGLIHAPTPQGNHQQHSEHDHQMDHDHHNHSAPAWRGAVPGADVAAVGEAIR